VENKLFRALDIISVAVIKQATGHDGSAELVTTNEYSRQTITYVSSSTASRNLLSMTKWIRTELQLPNYKD
jgi:hypothetical protein